MQGQNIFADSPHANSVIYESMQNLLLGFTPIISSYNFE